MSELSHDTADEGFHEIQLSGKQLVFLFIVTTTVIVVVFLCGVKVGRGARAAQGEESDQPATTAAVSQAQSPTPATSAETAPRPAEPPTPADEAAVPLSYSERLKGGTPADEKLKQQTDSPTATAEPAPRPAAPAAATRTAPAVEAADVPTSGRAGTWAVQVIATRDRNMATSIVKRLAGRDYPAYLVNPSAGSGPGFYKVQVGRYNDRAEAARVSARIQKEEQFQSWITR